MADEMTLLRAAKSAREALFTVHYACQNFNEVTDRPPMVSCVSYYDVHAGDAHAFSMANVGSAETTAEQREVLLIEGALRFLRDHGEARWLHWKMNRPEFGFEALADRLRWLGHEPPSLPSPDRRHDLDALIAERYGRNYASHPRLPNLLIRNGISNEAPPRTAKAGG